MLTPYERSEIWQEFYDRVHRLFSDAEDVLSGKFAPYEFENGELVRPDKDTPEAKKLFDMLADLDEFLSERKKKAEQEYSYWLDVEVNKQKAFDAWRLGLCPQVMRSIPQFSMFHSWHVWEKIAQLKQEQGISKEDTLQAVALWEAHQTIEHIAS